MLIAMVSGILVGLLFMAARQALGADSAAWSMINNILFQDITAKGAESAIGLFYIGGQLFIRALQLIIVPMVFCSVVMAISEISEASTLGRVSAKTIGWFMMTSSIALWLRVPLPWFSINPVCSTYILKVLRQAPVPPAPIRCW